MTKTFVATVALQLVDEGRIGMDDPIGRYLPGLIPGGDDGMPVTVRQLLHHTSGIPHYTDVLRRGDDPIRRLSIRTTRPASWSGSH
ncbi:serine hydrolase [Streptomyces sp. NPDC048196]|uniref:serine hydrolase domain-containing protein n=1 Tax=Streptomyces sp. NPDC048196 TaxID=3154712 RepID=UPI00340D1F6E